VNSLRLLTSLGTAILITIFWDSTLLFPFKQFVVYVHEIWHGLISMAVGAKLEKIILYPGESGETMVKELHGHFAFAAAVSAGYLGSVLTGGFILNRGLLGSGEKYTLGFFGSFIIYITLLFTDSGSAAFWSGFIFGSGFLISLFLPLKSVRYIMIVTGTAMVWYSIFDILDFTRDVNRTDAGILVSYLYSQNLLPADPAYKSFYANTVSIIWVLFIGTMLFYLLRPVLKAGIHEELPDSEITDPNAASNAAENTNIPDMPIIPEMDVNNLQIPGLSEEIKNQPLHH
jgi:hypothetical protein